MARFPRFALVLIAIAGSVAAAIGRASVAGAAPPHPIDVLPIVRATVAPTSVPLPRRTPNLPMNVRALPSARPVNVNVLSQWHFERPAARPGKVPPLSKFLVKRGKDRFAVRDVPNPSQRALVTRLGARPMAADGSTIILTGDSNNYFEYDVTLQYGANVYVMCENMPTGTNYRYAIWTPDGKGPYYTSYTGVNASGTCNSYGNFTLATPYGTGTDPAYPGVWVVAMQSQSSGKFVTEMNVIANSALNITTYSDTAQSNQTNDFTAGSVIDVGASGLNPNDSYALGWVLTSGSGLPCTFSLPNYVAGNTGVCFTGSVGGIQAFNGSLNQWWGPANSPSTNSAATGTYDVELYDATQSQMVAHQQISIEPSTISWTLTPYNSTGATPVPGLSYDNAFATDGLIDQSVTGLTYSASGLPSASNGHVLTLSVGDPNGVILTGNSSYPTIAKPPSVTQSGGAISTQVAFPYNTTYQTALGPTQNPFAPNVLTAQLYDRTLGTVIGSKSFQLLGYNAAFTWNGQSYVNAAPGTQVTQTVTIQNTGASDYGAWNGDSIDGVNILPDANYNEQLYLGSTTATDSAGNTWTITQIGSGSNAYINAVPNVAGAGLPAGGTLSFNIGPQNRQRSVQLGTMLLRHADPAAPRYRLQRFEYGKQRSRRARARRLRFERRCYGDVAGRQ
jgi:hypothetical protein